MPTLRTSARPKWRAAITAVAAGAALLTTLSGFATAEAADTTVANDGFDRTSASGWGDAVTGGSWTVRGGSGSSTGSSEGTVSGVAASGTAAAYLSSVSADDVVVRAAFVVPSTPVFYYSAEGRRQSDGSAYRSRAYINGGKLRVELVRANGRSETWLASSASIPAVSAGQTVTVELSVSGTSTVSVKGRAYISGSTAPDWQVTKNDDSSSRVASAGGVGIRAYVSEGGSTTAVRTAAFSAVTGSTTTTPPTTTPPTPTPTPTTPAPTVPATTSTRGAATVGSTSYAVPSGAVFVATNGNDSNAGTEDSPVKTVTKALTKVKSKGAVVLRGGTYHEYFIVPPGKDVSIQSYPKEAVWFDGSSTVSGFEASGNTWKVDDWTTQFDSSPTYTRGQADGTTDGWQFVNPAHSMAAHPDQVWIDNVEQTQVASLGEVKAGSFFVDYGARRLYLGSNPSGKTVAASTLSQAVSMRAPGAVLRGLGFRRYADSVWMQGIINSYYPNMTLENVDIRDSATGGIGIYGVNSTLDGVTVVGSGQLAIQTGAADNLTMNNVSVRNSNDEHFNPAPSAGGFKLHNSRGVTLTNSEILNTDGNQFWTDTSTQGITLANNNIIGGTRYGVVLEISSTATVVNNVVADNAYDGIAISDTDNASIWNNTLVDNGHAALSLVQDYRRITNLSVYGHDNRRAQPDMSMPWITRGTSIGNNIYSARSTSNAVFQAESWDKTMDGNDMVANANGNVFAQPGAGSPGVVVRWGKKGTYATQHKSFDAYVAATGYDKNSVSVYGNPVDGSYRATAAVSSKESSVAQALPSWVANSAGVPSGTKHLGAWR